MGMRGPFSKSCSSSSYSTTPEDATAPDPIRWEMVGTWQFTNAYVLQVRYLDCKNYEGLKLMVYAGRYKHQPILDPHFSEDRRVSPIARFRPDAKGLERACDFAEGL